MSASFCIHGHFYQPPREDPWLGIILPEASAAPMMHWNERITRESYAPLAFARRLDAQGNIADIVNCYEWINFNVGPTLMRWLAREMPEVAKRMQAGDAHSLRRLGHGNAIAQVYHHVILPLASLQDKRCEVRWAVADFQYHFGRAPQGMWLSECAVDTPTLEVLAEEGISFVILAPRQAKAVVTATGETPVDESSLNIGQGYVVQLPSGKRMNVLFYHGALSQRIAFEGLLGNGETFWNRIVEAARQSQATSPEALTTIATDGETYGHHFPFGEMALAYVLEQALARRDNIFLTNVAAYFAAHPPTCQVVLHEPSSWSCVHGVERWRSDCGCTTGGHPGWNQRWRTPLRNALEFMREAVNAHFTRTAAPIMHNPAEALLDYGTVLANPERAEQFAAQWFTNDKTVHDVGWKLLVMQEQALAAFASCAWFFDDLYRLEPQHSLGYAYRAFELMHLTGGVAPLEEFKALLEEAVSNAPHHGNGKQFFEQEVLTQADTPATLLLTGCVRLQCEEREPPIGQPVQCMFPHVGIELTVQQYNEETRVLEGTGGIRNPHETHGRVVQWRWQPLSLSVAPGVPFASLAHTHLEVTETQGERRRYTASLNDFSPATRSYLLMLVLQAEERRRKPALAAAAKHILAMLPHWNTEQYPVQAPEWWNGLSPYLLLEMLHATSGAQQHQIFPGQPLLQWRQEDLNQLATIVRDLATPATRRLGSRFVQDYFFARLQCPHSTDAHLARQVAMVQAVFPENDWWAVQNKVWELGVGQWPLLASQLGFA